MLCMWFMVGQILPSQLELMQYTFNTEVLVVLLLHMTTMLPSMSKEVPPKSIMP